MPSIFLKPKAGRQVPYPDINAMLPEAGASVEDSQYWQRRLLDGDVEIAEPPKSVADPIPAPAK